MEGALVYGLDLGINNVGWCALRKGNGEVEVLGVGTFVFDSPLEDANKPGEGLKSKLRGQFRRARRTTRRRHQRKMDLYRLLAEHGFLPPKMADRVELFCKEPNPYALRAAALERKLEPFELGRVLCHLNQRRGFLSPRDLMLWGVAPKFEDEDEADGQEASALAADKKETGQIKKEIKATAEAMAGFETIGAFLWHRVRKGEPVRKKQLNRPGTKTKLPKTDPAQKREDERRYVRADRHMTEQEFRTLMERQAPHHPLLTEALQDKIKHLLFDQRILAADASTRGKCRFFKKELRMPRASLTGQKYVIAEDVAHLEVIPGPMQDSRKLTAEERLLLVDALMGGHDFPKLIAEERLALIDTLMGGNDFSWVQVKKIVGLAPAAIFSIEPSKILVKGKEKLVKRSGTKEKLRGSQTVERMRKVLGEKWDALGQQAQRELVGEIVSIRDWTRDANTRPAAFRRLDLFKNKAYGPNAVTFTEREANELATADLPEGYLSVSIRAAKKILAPMLIERDWEVKDKDGNAETLHGPLVYSDACRAVGLDHANPEGELDTLDRLPFPTDKDIAHAVVRASVRGAVRILNALHREHGKPDAIHIELPRDLAVGAQQREEVEKRQRENESERKEIAKELVALGIKPNGLNIKKVRLWKELGGAALPYEPKVIIPDLRALMNADYEIDHIVPRSHALDSGMANLTLCTREFNTQLKGNQTLWEAIGMKDPERWRHIEAHVKGIKNMPLHKRQRILAKERPEDFTGRHLAATGYISREVLKLAQRMVENKTDVVVAPGRATFEFRKFWEIDDLVPLHPEEQAAEDAWKAFQRLIEALNGLSESKATEAEVKFARTEWAAALEHSDSFLPKDKRKHVKRASPLLELLLGQRMTSDEAQGCLCSDQMAKLVAEHERPDGKTRSNFKHHALDAIVVALADRKSLKAMTDYYQLKELHDARLRDKEHKKLERARAMPDPNLRDKVVAALERAVIVHRPQRRPKGQLHKQQPEEKVVQGMRDGEPWGTAIVGKHLVNYDQDGKPAQAYPLGSNHHVVIWERMVPNKKDEYERAAEVVPMIEAVRRRDKKEPVIRKTRPEPGWRFVMALCKGDMVEMADGTQAVVSKFSVTSSEGGADIALWRLEVARQLGGLGKMNPYLVSRITGREGLSALGSRVVLDPRGTVVYREGGHE